MKVFTLSNVINVAFQYVIKTSKMYNIDESHALRHSMDVFHFANQIYNSELSQNPFLEEQKPIIMCSAILHDMCDKKYVNEKDGINEMNDYMRLKLPTQDLSVVNQIINTMSYSTVKKFGYPKLNKHMLAYHIVREADLLAGYDVERCIIYQMMHEKYSYVHSLRFVKELFHKRMLKYREENLFVTEYSKHKSLELHESAIKKLEEIEQNSIHFL